MMPVVNVRAVVSRTAVLFLFDTREELDVDDVLKVTFPVRRVVCDSKSTVLRSPCKSKYL